MQASTIPGWETVWLMPTLWNANRRNTKNANDAKLYIHLLILRKSPLLVFGPEGPRAKLFVRQIPSMDGFSPGSALHILQWITLKDKERRECCTLQSANLQNPSCFSLDKSSSCLESSSLRSRVLFQELDKAALKWLESQIKVEYKPKSILKFQDGNMALAWKRMRGVTKCQPVELGETLPPGHCEERCFCQEKNPWLEITGGHQPCALARQLHLPEQLLLPLHPRPQL